MKQFLLKWLKWPYFAICTLGAVFFFWIPLWWWYTPPLGLTVAVILCLSKAWHFPGYLSIKPLPGRGYVDAWPALFDPLWGNPEDGVSGVDAYGPSWKNSYNPTGSRWGAIKWNCRNWLAGFNYITWRAWMGAPPLIVKEYSLPSFVVPTWVPKLGGLQIGGQTRQLKIGWQQRYGQTVMVCSA